MFVYVRIIVAGVVAVALAGAVQVQAQQRPEDLLNRAKAEQSLMLQKIDARMREAIQTARRLQDSSPTRAVNALKLAQANLDDPLLPESYRASWNRQISSMIRSIETGQKLKEPEALNPIKKQIREEDRARARAIKDEYYDVKRGVETITALVRSGNTIQAQREIEALTRRYPNNPALLVLNDKLGTKNYLNEAKVLAHQQAEGFMLAMRSVENSSIPPKEDLEFDREYFRRISKLRMKSEYTAKEKAIFKALDSSISLGFKDAPFDQVIQFISKSMGVPILLDKAALAEGMLESSTPVSLTLSNVASRTALRKLLQDHNLTFIIKEESIQVVTITKARETLVTRVYPVRDLLSTPGFLGGSVTWGPWMEMAQADEASKLLIQSIQNIDPDSWKDRGGNGTVIFHWPSMSLIVRQTTEVHARLAGIR